MSDRGFIFAAAATAVVLVACSHADRHLDRAAGSAAANGPTPSATEDTPVTTAGRQGGTRNSASPSTDGVGKAGGPGRTLAHPAFTHVSLTLDTTSEWTTVEVVGADLIVKHFAQAPPAVNVSDFTNGFSVTTKEQHPLGAIAKPSTTAPAGPNVVVEAVYRVAPDTSPKIRICKGNNGRAALTVVRATYGTATVSAVTDSNTDGSQTGGCANATVASVNRSDLVGPTAWPPPIDPRRLVLAFYYPWYSAATFTDPHFAERPTGPAATDDPAAVAAMVDQARGDGIDGLVVSYNGNPELARRFDLVAAASDARPGTSVSGLLELGYLAQQHRGSVPPSDLEAWIRDVLRRSNGPSALKVSGRPVVFFYGAAQLDPAAWADVRSRLQASGLDPFVVGDTTDQRFGFDGEYAYSPNTVPDPSRLDGWYVENAKAAQFAPAVDPAAGRPRLWAAPVSPGEDDSRLGRPRENTIVLQRAGGGRYDNTWAAATATDPEWIVVTTWNEWYEGTNVQPGTATGALALDQTRSWSTAFKD